MDIAASPVSSTNPTIRSSENTELQAKKHGFSANEFITTQEESEHPSELPRPPVLKHVCVKKKGLPYFSL